MTLIERHEKVARHLIDRTQHGKVANAFVLKGFDESPTRAAEFGLYVSCHQSVAELRISRFVRSRCKGVTEI